MTYESQSLPHPGILKDIQILIVDNDADSRYLCKTLFEIYGAQVTTLESIANSIALLDHLIPDIVICEIRFFNEDVLSLIQKIKTVSLGRERVIPILVVSAYCVAGFAQNLLTMVEDYLLKPIDIDHLVDEVWNLVHLAKETQKVNIQDWAVKHGATITAYLAAPLS
jgi:CheY-like chemotaxis protein